jgi:TetR/AcrR family transcriptional repressor of lmrAB and yxaGH operons
MSAARAGSLASLIISAIEGAIIQSRALKSTRPLDYAQEHLMALLSGAHA